MRDHEPLGIWNLSLISKVILEFYPIENKHVTLGRQPKLSVVFDRDTEDDYPITKYLGKTLRSSILVCSFLTLFHFMSVGTKSHLGAYWAVMFARYKIHSNLTP